MDLVYVHFNSKLAEKIHGTITKPGFVDWVADPSDEDSDSVMSGDEDLEVEVGDDEGTAAITDLFTEIEGGEQWTGMGEEDEEEGEEGDAADGMHSDGGSSGDDDASPVSARGSRSRANDSGEDQRGGKRQRMR